MDMSGMNCFVPHSPELQKPAEMQNKRVPVISVRFRILPERRIDNSRGPLRRWSTVRSATEGALDPATTKDQPEHGSKRKHYAGKKALVVGSGPAGSVASSFLVKQGFQVDVFEQRKDPTKTLVAPTRSISVALNGATVKTLESAGIDTPSADEGYTNGMHRFFGASFLTPSGELMAPVPGFKGWLLVERIDLATNVMDIVRRENPERMTFHFEHPCVGVDLTKQEVQFQDHNGNIVKWKYDLLIGADGVDSQVREAIGEHIDNFKVLITLSAYFYVSCPNIVVNEDQVPEKYKKMIQPGAVSFYAGAPKSKSIKNGFRMAFSILASGNLSCVISAIESELESLKANADEYLKEALPDDFPKDWMEQMIQQLKANPLNRIPSITEVSTLVGPNVVLIGDAGHAVSPELGFGCNMAIQDGLALNEALGSAEGDINQALKTFNDNRYKKIRDFQLLEKVASATMIEVEGIQKLLPLFAAIHILFHSLGNRYIPWLVPKTATRRCFLEEISSGEAVRILQIELATLLALATSVVCLTIAVIVRLS